MIEFLYKAISPNGKKIKGTIKAGSESGAKSLLKKQDYTVLYLEPRSKINIFSVFTKRVSIKEKILFTEELGVMMKAGLSVVDALKSLGEECPNQYFRKAIGDIKTSVEGGSSLSDGLRAYPSIFPEVYVEIVKSGEVTGSLDEVLKKLAVQLEKDFELISKVKGAMIYPIIITCLLIGVIIIIITYIIPKLKDVFAEAGAELPLATRVLLGVSDGFLKYGWIVVIAIVGLIISFRKITKGGPGQHFWHQIKLRVPIFGNFSKKIILARFSQTFSSLSGAGVPVLKVFDTTENIVNNVIIKEDVKKIAEDVKQGLSISFAFRKSKHFPTMIAQMTAVGEKSGEMQEVFSIIADFYEKEVDNLAKNLSTAIEPIIMIIMGLGVAFILMAVLQPIYGLVSAM